MSRDPALERALSRRLAVKRISEAVGITTAAVSQWRRVPKKHVLAVADLTGVPASELRPDLYEPSLSNEAAA